MTPPRLTIGVPTYNRLTSVSQRVQEFVELGLPDDIELLVIDNASTDGTSESLRSAPDGVRVLRNDANLGYAGNLLRVLEEADGDYVVVVSDEDALVGEGLSELLAFCATHAPEFVSPRAQVGDNDAYRGRRETRRIAGAEFESAAFYMSGLTFKRTTLSDDLELVRSLAPANSAANVYPQVLLSALAIARGGSWFLDALVTRHLDERETAITEANGAVYYFVSARWAQHLGYESFFASGAIPATDGVLDQMTDALRARLLPLLADAAVLESPALAPYVRPESKGRLRPFVGRIIRRVLRR